MPTILQSVKLFWIVMQDAIFALLADIAFLFEYRDCVDLA